VLRDTICEKDQQDARFFLVINFNQIILDMFRTNIYSSSGRLYKQLTAFFREYQSYPVSD